MMRTAMLALMIAPGMYITPAAAQDCGEYCNGCPTGTGFKEGTGFHPQGAYNMSCYFVGVGEGCVECEAPGSDMVASDLIAHAVQSASASELGLLLATYGDRLLFAPERGAVIVKGVPCDRERISKMVFVSADQARGLEGLGIRSLRAFLEEQSSVAPAADMVGEDQGKR